MWNKRLRRWHRGHWRHRRHRWWTLTKTCRLRLEGRRQEAVDTRRLRVERRRRKALEARRLRLQWHLRILLEVGLETRLEALLHSRLEPCGLGLHRGCKTLLLWLEPRWLRHHACRLRHHSCWLRHHSRWLRHHAILLRVLELRLLLRESRHLWLHLLLHSLCVQVLQTLPWWSDLSMHVWLITRKLSLQWRGGTKGALLWVHRRGRGSHRGRSNEPALSLLLRWSRSHPRGCHLLGSHSLDGCYLVKQRRVSTLWCLLSRWSGRLISYRWLRRCWSGNLGS